MRITKLTIDNFKRLTAVTIIPDGSTVIVGGRNEQGKSSTLDAIEAALGGKRHAPEEPIKRGARKSRIVLQTETMRVQRKFTAKGSTLEVKAKDGTTYGSPQKMLDELVGRLSFDPLEFSRMDPKAQAETLRNLVGLDTDEISAKRAAAYASRTDINRDLRRVSAELEGIERDDEAPAEEVSVVELAKELDVRVATNAKRGQLSNELDALRERKEETIRQIAELNEKLKTINEQGLSLRRERDALEVQDCDSIRAQIELAESTNAAVRTNARHDELAAEHEKWVDKSEALTKTIDDLDAQKKEALEAVEYPVDGLAVSEEGVTLKGLPFSQASQAERLRCSVAIGLRLNPELKLLLIRDGSYLDEDSLRLVAEMAEAADAQVWLERVGKGEECTVIIEDGEVEGPALAEAG